MKIVDVSGYGNSGKTAISEYLLASRQIRGFAPSVEFELFRINFGLYDLYDAAVENWNPMRFTYRLKRFERVIKRISGIVKMGNPFSYLLYSGHSYNKTIGPHFSAASFEFIDALKLHSVNYLNPFCNLYNSNLELFYNKSNYIISGKIPEVEVFMVFREKFIELLNQYIESIFLPILNEQQHTIALNNAFEPYNALGCLKFIRNAKSIVVKRDPRDIYANVQLFNSSKIFVPKFELYKEADFIKKKVSNTNDIEKFCLRYRTLMENSYFESDRIMVINFEDFILKHNEYSEIINTYLDLNPDLFEKREFDTLKSSKNIGLWKHLGNDPGLQIITDQLSQYCYTG
jgi:hypothetical protein